MISVTESPSVDYIDQLHQYVWSILVPCDLPGEPSARRFSSAVLVAGAITLTVGARYGAKYFGYEQIYDHDSSRAHAE